MAQTSRKHALIIVDLQKDFLPGGALAVPGGDKIVPVIHEVLEFLGLHRHDPGLASCGSRLLCPEP